MTLLALIGFLEDKDQDEIMKVGLCKPHVNNSELTFKTVENITARECLVNVRIGCKSVMFLTKNLL